MWAAGGVGRQAGWCLVDYGLWMLSLVCGLGGGVTRGDVGRGGWGRAEVVVRMLMGGGAGGGCWCLGGGWRWVPIDADDRTRYMNKIFN